VARKIKVAVIDDHPLILKAVVDGLAAQNDIHVVATADHGSAMHRLAREKAPDVIILDLGMSNGPFEPVSAVRSFVESYPDIQVLILTGYDDELYVRALIEAGARGYVFKSDDLSLHLPEGVRTVHKRQRFYTPAVMEKLFVARETGDLSDQELAVLRLAAEGLANSAIARTLGVSEKRVRNIMSSIYEKLSVGEQAGMNLRVVAVNKARELGLLPQE
jgi:DNA-binding NarL/FixJ family response regulator